MDARRAVTFSIARSPGMQAPASGGCEPVAGQHHEDPRERPHPRIAAIVGPFAACRAALSIAAVVSAIAVVTTTAYGQGR